MTVTPRCPIYKHCGGCQYQHITYPEELKEKEHHLKEILQLPEHLFDAITASPKEYHYRHRLDLRLHRHKEHGIMIGFCPPGAKRVVETDQCPIAVEAISNFIPQLKQEAVAALPDKYKVASLVLRCGDEGKVYWGGIGEGSLKMAEADYMFTNLCGRRIYYAMESFFQANLSILPILMERLRSLDIWKKRGVFFDLYGGVGLFGLCLSDLVDHVLLIEENKMATKVAIHNVNYNKLNNFRILHGKVEDVLPPLVEKYQEQHKVVMVDPPRAGLTQSSIALLNSLKNVEHLLYLSCHPNSLRSDLQGLSSHWQVKRVMPFDFFPKTKHLETLVLLEANML